MSSSVAIWFPDGDERFLVELKGEDSIREFKKRVSEVSDVPDDNFNLFYEGTVLQEGEEMVVDFGIGPESELTATIKPECIARNKLLKERRDLTMEGFFREVGHAGSQIITYIEAGFDVNARNVEGLTVLSIACGFHRTRIEDVLGLLKSGATVHTADYSDITPLMYAATNSGSNLVPIISRLLEEELIEINAVNSTGATALLLLCRNCSAGSLEALQLMLSHPELDIISQTSKLSKDSLLHAVSLNRSPHAAEMMALLFQFDVLVKLVNQRDGLQNTAFTYAVSSPSDAALVLTEMLLREGADPTILGCGGVSPLMRCCRGTGGYHKIEILKSILDPTLYTDFNSSLEEFVNISRKGATALTEAICFGGEDGADVVSMLLAAGAQLTVEAEVNPPLVSCCELVRDNAVGILEVLLAVPNIEINIKTSAGTTPLSAAVTNRNPVNALALTEILLARGARLSTESFNPRPLVESQPEPFRSQILQLFSDSV